MKIGERAGGRGGASAAGNRTEKCTCAELAAAEVLSAGQNYSTQRRRDAEGAGDYSD
jgi:hypothetical protein